MKDIIEKGKHTEEHINDGFYCENSKVLEVVLEHIIFHWDDIMEVLIDDLLEEEALELNCIEQQRTDQIPRPK